MSLVDDLEKCIRGFGYGSKLPKEQRDLLDICKERFNELADLRRQLAEARMRKDAEPTCDFCGRNRSDPIHGEGPNVHAYVNRQDTEHLGGPAQEREEE